MAKRGNMFRAKGKVRSRKHENRFTVGEIGERKTENKCLSDQHKEASGVRENVGKPKDGTIAKKTCATVQRERGPAVRNSQDDDVEYGRGRALGKKMLKVSL